MLMLTLTLMPLTQLINMIVVFIDINNNSIIIVVIVFPNTTTRTLSILNQEPIGLLLQIR